MYFLLKYLNCSATFHNCPKCYKYRMSRYAFIILNECEKYANEIFRQTNPSYLWRNWRFCRRICLDREHTCRWFYYRQNTSLELGLEKITFFAWGALAERNLRRILTKLLIATLSYKIQKRKWTLIN